MSLAPDNSSVNADTKRSARERDINSKQVANAKQPDANFLAKSSACKSPVSGGCFGPSAIGDAMINAAKNNSIQNGSEPVPRLAPGIVTARRGVFLLVVVK